MYTVGYGATGTGAGRQPLRHVPLPAPATCIGAGLELAAAATPAGMYIWGLLRTPEGLVHLPQPVRVAGPALEASSIAVGREAVWVLGR